jgi:hypothetical protein
MYVVMLDRGLSRPHGADEENTANLMAPRPDPLQSIDYYEEMKPVDYVRLKDDISEAAAHRLDFELKQCKASYSMPC